MSQFFSIFLLQILSNFAKKAAKTNKKPPKRAYQCYVCRKELSNNSRMHRHRHMQDSHLPKKHLCKCYKTFARLELLNRHKATCVCDTLLDSSVLKIQSAMVVARENMAGLKPEDAQERARIYREGIPEELLGFLDD